MSEEINDNGLTSDAPATEPEIENPEDNVVPHKVDEQQEKDIKSFVAPYAKNDNLVITINDEGTPIIFNTSRYDIYDYPNK